MRFNSGEIALSATSIRVLSKIVSPMSIIEKLKAALKDSLRAKLGKVDLTPLDVSDYIENKLGFIPIGLDYFFPSRKVLMQLLLNQIRQDKELSFILDDKTIRYHIGEEEIPDSLYTSIFLYIFSKRILLLRRWLKDELEDASVLEVGDSDGIILNNLGKTGIGVNISSGAVKNIFQHNIRAVQCDIGRMPFKPKTFDIVMMFETLEHLINPIEALNILAGISKKKVIISIPVVPKTKILAAGYKDNLPQYRQHVFEFDDADLRKILTHTPFIINRREIINVFGMPKTFAQLRLYLYCNHKYLWAGLLRRQVYYELIFKEGYRNR